MSKLPKTEPLTLSYRAAEEKQAPVGLRRFLAYLVFKAHGVRVGLELSACVLGYALATWLIPWQSLGVAERWSTLISWFGCCFLIILFDQLLLCRSVYAFRKSYLLTLAGSYGDALAELEKIGPDSNAFIPLPAAMYYLQRAEILIYAENFRAAEAELALAEAHGADKEQLYILCARNYLAQGESSRAFDVLETATKELGSTAALRLEEGVTYLSLRQDLWHAKRTFKEVMEMPDTAHFAGESTRRLAKAYYQATRLWTGEAEEGLEGINQAIDRLRSMVPYVDTLRPILSQLLLERSHYLATHRAPNAAVVDLKIALAFCINPYLQAKSNTIRDELEWRHELCV